MPCGGIIYNIHYTYIPNDMLPIITREFTRWLGLELGLEPGLLHGIRDTVRDDSLTNYVVLKILGQNPDVNLPINTEGDTILTLATSRGDQGLVNRVLDLKADVNAQNARGDTALIIASRVPEDHSVDMVSLLLDNNANINLQEQNHSLMYV